MRWFFFGFRGAATPAQLPGAARGGPRGPAAPGLRPRRGSTSSVSQRPTPVCVSGARVSSTAGRRGRAGGADGRPCEDDSELKAHRSDGPNVVPPHPPLSHSHSRTGTKERPSGLARARARHGGERGAAVAAAERPGQHALRRGVHGRGGGRRRPRARGRGAWAPAPAARRGVTDPPRPSASAMHPGAPSARHPSRHLTSPHVTLAASSPRSGGLLPPRLPARRQRPARGGRAPPPLPRPGEGRDAAQEEEQGEGHLQGWAFDLSPGWMPRNLDALLITSGGSPAARSRSIADVPSAPASSSARFARAEYFSTSPSGSRRAPLGACVLTGTARPSRGPVSTGGTPAETRLVPPRPRSAGAGRARG